MIGDKRRFKRKLSHNISMLWVTLWRRIGAGNCVWQSNATCHWLGANLESALYVCMCVCFVFVCMFMYMYVYIYVCMHACIYIYIYIIWYITKAHKSLHKLPNAYFHTVLPFSLIPVDMSANFIGSVEFRTRFCSWYSTVLGGNGHLKCNGCLTSGLGSNVWLWYGMG